MKVYISSSFKNIHLVKILTSNLRDNKIEVLSFLDSKHNKKHKVNQFDFKFDLEGFINSEEGLKQFQYDLNLVYFLKVKQLDYLEKWLYGNMII